MSEEAIDLEALLASMMPFVGGVVPLGAMAKDNKELIDLLRGYDPVETAAIFGGLLANPELQGNSYRLEALAHLALIGCQGAVAPRQTLIANAFTAAGEGLIGRQEDPTEDVLVSSIATNRGDFRIIEGCWECAGFYTQRIINVLERLPAAPRYDRIRETVYALLRLSDQVCSRAQLARHQLGHTEPLNELPPHVLDELGRWRNVVRFTEEEISSLGIDPIRLQEFGFDPPSRSTMDDDSVGHSRLERYPIAYQPGELTLLLPTAVSVAIRRLVIEEFSTGKMPELLAHLLAEEYASHFSKIPLLGKRSAAPLSFERTEDGLIAGVITSVDEGVYLQFLFYSDTLEGFAKTGMAGLYPETGKLTGDLDKAIEDAVQWSSARSGFRRGMTLVVACGLGRATTSAWTDTERRDWRVETVRASDLETMSWLPKFSPLSLWRILDAEDRLQELGVSLENINGLLNLVAWARSLGGHLVPHARLPSDFGSADVAQFIMIDQSALRSARHEALVAWDPHSVRDVEGRWRRVRRDIQSVFDDERDQPFFMTEDKGSGRWPQGVFESSNRAWWFSLTTPSDVRGPSAYERSKVLKTWICRAAPVLERNLRTLPNGPLQWEASFEGKPGNLSGFDPEKRMSLDGARAATSVRVHKERKTIAIIATAEFEKAMFHPENIAERALVERLVEGFVGLSGQDFSEAEHLRIVAEIVPNSSARQSHALMARDYRDWIRDAVWDSPVVIDAGDAAYIKLGLGWRVRDRVLGAEITGREDCTSFLNKVVRELEEEICADLRRLDRAAVIEFALMNHESAAVDRDQWHRTAAAVLSLRDDKEATLRTMAEHDFQNSAVFQTSRLLIEFAVCECPSDGGLKPGQLDMSRIMAKASMILGFGGWSDAIRWNAMEPTLHVSALGDIHGNTAFHQEVILPYGRAGSDLRVMEEVRRYPERFEQPDIAPEAVQRIAPDFLDAWTEEFGASFDELLQFVETVESVGLEKRQAVLKLSRSQLLALLSKSSQLPPHRPDGLIDMVTLRGRSRWRDVPEGFDQRDIFPWRFRRRLTILRRPFIQIDEGDDPTIVVAPGMLREALTYMLSNYHRGDFPLWQLRPKMKQWAGRSRNRLGREFTLSVAARLRELGWEADTEVRITRLLGKSFDRDYGDVDVLAWRTDERRVLLIECKDVQFRKTDGEIAEQLADFQGELGPDNKPDNLRRHLDRIDIVSRHLTELGEFVGMNGIQEVESHLVFKNPVPMQFAWKKLEERVRLHLFETLEHI